MNEMQSLGLGNSKIKQALGYRKFASSDACKVLILDGAYHLHSESASAFQRIGCTVTRIKVGDNVGQLVRNLLTALVQERPDFVLSINHIGFDEGNQIGALLDEFEIPVAVWCVDSPLFILKRAEFPAPKMTTLFLWEKTLEKPMAQFGAQDIHYLPLGTDPVGFALQDVRIDKQTVFVGDSMQHARKKWTDKLSNRSQKLAKTLTEQMLEGARFDTLLEATEEMELPPGDSKWDVWALAIYGATMRKRRGSVSVVTGRELHVYGDTGWKKVVPRATFHGGVNYGAPLAKVYASSVITLNTTSYQMPTAVNQRVFDVPLCGGFVLTDDQPDLHDHFEVGKEVICYENEQHLKELIAYYREHEEERKKISEAARDRILKEHLYDHRVAKMLSVLRKQHSLS